MENIGYGLFYVKHTASFNCGNLVCSHEDSLTPGPGCSKLD